MVEQQTITMQTVAPGLEEAKLYHHHLTSHNILVIILVNIINILNIIIISPYEK